MASRQQTIDRRRRRVTATGGAPRLRLKLLLLLSATWFWPALAWGAVPSEAAGSMGTGMGSWEYLKHLYVTGGPMMHAIMGLSLLGLFLTIYNWLTVQPSHLAPPVLSNDLSERLANGDLDGAGNLLRRHRSLLARTMHAAIRRFQALRGDATVTRTEHRAALREAMENAGRREAARLRQSIAYVANIATLATMLGLIGTIGAVIGLFGIPPAKYLPDARVITAGVMKALVTTGAGLAAGVVYMAAYVYLRAVLAAALSAAESACEQQADLLAKLLPRPAAGTAGREASAPALRAEVRPIATDARGPSSPAAETAPAEKAAEAAASDSTEEFIVVNNFDASAEEQFQEGRAYRFGQGQLEANAESGAEGESGESAEPRDTGAEASA